MEIYGRETILVLNRKVFAKITLCLFNLILGFYEFLNSKLSKQLAYVYGNHSVGRTPPFCINGDRNYPTHAIGPPPLEHGKIIEV